MQAQVLPPPSDDLQDSDITTALGNHMTNLAAVSMALGGAMALPAPTRMFTRTGGPDDDGDDENALLRKLMPILAAVIAMATIFGG